MSAPVRWTSFARAALIGAVAGVAACAQSTPEYQAKVVLLEKLTRFVEWPGQPFANRAFVLAVVGRTPFGDDLDTFFAARTVKGRPVELRYLRETSSFAGCDLLFLCASEKARLPALLARAKGQGILTVADTDGFAQAGVMVGLVRREAKVVFQVNLAPVREAGLRIAPGFLQLATLVP